MSGRGFTSAFAADLDAYLAFKQSMGFFGNSRIWYLRSFDAWCSPWASTSLPVPLSPSSKTLALLVATFSIVRQMRSISASR